MLADKFEGTPLSRAKERARRRDGEWEIKENKNIRPKRSNI